jgi:hypothetical protein
MADNVNMVKLRKLIGDINTRLDKMDFTIYENKTELEAKIEAKIDNLRCDLVDMNTVIDKRLNTFSEQLHDKFNQINEKIDFNKAETDLAIANISGDVLNMNHKIESFLEQDFTKLIDERVIPTINVIRKDQDYLFKKLEDLENVVGGIIEKPNATREEVYDCFKALEIDIGEVKGQQQETKETLVKAKAELDNLGRNLEQNMANVSVRVNKLEHKPRKKNDHSIDPNDWVEDREVGDKTLNEFSLMRELAANENVLAKKKKSRKKKYKSKKKEVVESTDDDPGGSDPSSSSSNEFSASESDGSE